MQLVPLTEYTAEELDAALGVDGPCLLRDGTFALFVSFRGRDGGTMPTPAELHWRRDVPAKMRTDPAHLFLRDRSGKSATYLGPIVFARTGHPARDGFKILFRLSEPLADASWRDLVAAATAPPPPAPEEAIAKLTPHSTMLDRMAAMRVFVDRWYGTVAPTDDAGVPLPTSVPAPLYELYNLAAKRRLFGQNRLIPPNELVVEDGKMAFYIENQGVCTWAIDAAGDDPKVFVRGDSSTNPWREEAPRLSGFLIQVLIYEAALRGEHFSASTDVAGQALVQKLKRHVAALALPAWATSKTRFFGSNGIIGFATPDGSSFNVHLAAREREPFEAIEEWISDWPHIGF